MGWLLDVSVNITRSLAKEKRSSLFFRSVEEKKSFMRLTLTNKTNEI
jgi:hypothetical protein